MVDTNNPSNDSSSAWNGVTIEELKYMRAVALVKLELQKELLKNKTREKFPFGSTTSQGLIGGITNKLTLVQKIMLFMKGVRLASSVVTFFKTSKKR